MLDNDPTDGRTRPSLGALAANVVGNVIALAKAEVNDFAQQAKQKAIESAVAIGLLVGAGLLAIIVLCYVVFAAYLGLAHVLPDWAAALIVALIFALVAGVFALIARVLLKRHATPSVPATVERIKGEVSGAFADGRAAAGPAAGPTTVFTSAAAPAPTATDQEA